MTFGQVANMKTKQNKNIQFRWKMKRSNFEKLKKF